MILNDPCKKNEGEALSPLQASGLGSKLRAAAGYPLGLSCVDPLATRASVIPFASQFQTPLMPI